MNAVLILVLIFLIGVSIIDILFKKIPSFISTTMILLLLILYPENLVFGVMGLTFAWLIYEMFEGDYIGGIADVKVSVIIGLLISNIFTFAVYMLLLTFTGFLYVTTLKVIYEKKGKVPKEVAFLPVFLILYIGLWVGGLI